MWHCCIKIKTSSSELGCYCVSETGTWRRISANDRGGPFHLHTENQSVECRNPGLCWIVNTRPLYGLCQGVAYFQTFFLDFVRRRLWWTILSRWSPISPTLEASWCWWCAGSQQIIKLQIQLLARHHHLKNAGWFAMCSPLKMWVFFLCLCVSGHTMKTYPDLNVLFFRHFNSTKNLTE